MHRACLLVVTLCIAATIVAAQSQPECHTFQSLNIPTVSPDLTRCGSDSYKGSSCCSRASAKRAYNWVYEDDGCGVVGYVCAVAMTDLACAVNCGTNLIVTGVNYNNSRPVLPGKVVISPSFADRLWTACSPYAWCGTQQQFTTDCKFLALTRSNNDKGTSLTLKQSPDTCTLVIDLNPVTFAENILGLVVAETEELGFSSPIVVVPYVKAAATATTASAALLATLAAAVLLLTRA